MGVNGSPATPLGSASEYRARAVGKTAAEPCTDHNPNVLFELGLRMAAEKPVALIKSAGTGRVFDVDNMLRVYEYQPNLWRSTVETDLPELTKHFKAAWEQRSKNQSYMKILRRSGKDEGAA